jgi:hypothetical protein
MAYTSRTTRYRGSRKRVASVRFTALDKRVAALILVLCVAAIIVGAWLAANYPD